MCEYFVSMCALCVSSYYRNYMMFVFRVSQIMRERVLCVSWPKRKGLFWKFVFGVKPIHLYHSCVLVIS